MDLAETREWLLQRGSGANAKARPGEIRSAIRKLPDFPEAGNPSHARGIRVLVVARHRVFYSVTPGNVRVLRVLGPGQDDSAV
jgi:plasmid stabilization system protein ParE